MGILCVLKHSQPCPDLRSHTVDRSNTLSFFFFRNILLPTFDKFLTLSNMPSGKMKVSMCFEYTSIDLPRTIREDSICSTDSHVSLLDGERQTRETFCLSEDCDGFDFGFLNQVVQESADKERRMSNAYARMGIEEMHSQHSEKFPKKPMFLELPRSDSDSSKGSLELSESMTETEKAVQTQIPMTLHKIIRAWRERAHVLPTVTVYKPEMGSFRSDYSYRVIKPTMAF